MTINVNKNTQKLKIKISKYIYILQIITSEKMR